MHGVENNLLIVTYSVILLCYIFLLFVKLDCTSHLYCISVWGKHPLNSIGIVRFRFCENITHYKSTLKFYQKIFITLRSRVQIPVSLHENQGLTLNRGSFVVSAWGFALGFAWVFCHFLPKTRTFNTDNSTTVKTFGG